MGITLKITFAAVLLAASAAARAAAPETGPAARSAVELPKAVAGAPAPPAPAPVPAIPATVPLKIEKLELSAAIGELSQEDPKAVSEIYRSVSNLYIGKQQIDKAISLLDTYLGQKGADQSLLPVLANLYMQRGALKEAAGICEKVLKTDTGNVHAILMLADLYRQEGDIKKQIVLLESGLKSDPKNPELLMRAMNLYREAGDLDKAVEAAGRAIAVQPQAWYYQQLAYFYSEQKKTDAALAALKRGILKLPESEAELSIAMSDIYLKSDQKEKAVKLLKELLKKVNDPIHKDGIESRLRSMEQEAAAAPVHVPGEPPVAVSTQAAGKPR